MDGRFFMGRLFEFERIFKQRRRRVYFLEGCRRGFLAEGDFEIERSLLCILDFLGFCRLKIRRITTVDI